MTPDVVLGKIRLSALDDAHHFEGGVRVFWATSGQAKIANLGLEMTIQENVATLRLCATSMLITFPTTFLKAQAFSYLDITVNNIVCVEMHQPSGRSQRDIGSLIPC